MSSTSAPPIRLTAPPPGWSVRSPGGTGLATAALVLGIASLVLNVLLVPTMLAIVFGAVSLAKGTAARRRAIAGIVLGACGILASVFWAVLVYSAVHTGVAQATVESALLRDLSARSDGALVVVECPALPRIAAGATTVCSARSQSFGMLRLDVTFTDAEGGFTYRAARVG